MTAARWLTSAALTAVLAAVPVVALAQDASETAAEISANVMSPFCPGLTLHDCPSDAAVRLRDRIERWVRGGATRDEIMARLRRDYGPAVVATPPPEGAGLIAWLLPAVAVAVGAAVAFRLAGRWSARVRTPFVPEASSDERTRLASELADLRRDT